MSEDSSNTLEYGRALRARRKALSMTQQDLAELSGVSLSFIHDLENGKPTVWFGRVIDVARTLGLELQFHPRRGTSR